MLLLLIWKALDLILAKCMLRWVEWNHWLAYTHSKLQSQSYYQERTRGCRNGGHYSWTVHQNCNYFPAWAILQEHCLINVRSLVAKLPDINYIQEGSDLMRACALHVFLCNMAWPDCLLVNLHPQYIHSNHTVCVVWPLTLLTQQQQKA